MIRTSGTRRWRLATTVVVAALVVSACSGNGGEEASESGPSGGSGGGTAAAGGSIELWGTENQPERVAIVEEVMQRFTEASGIEVEYVPVAEDELPSLMVSSAASGDLPDVVYHPIDFTAGWAAQGLLNSEAIGAALDSLGPDTFSQGALDLVTVDDQVAALPSDGWGQLLIYRQDLFDEAGLEAPESYDAIRAAASALNDPGQDLAGITLSTDPAAVFTQQTFEHFALANGCQLVNDAGEVTLSSSNCQEAIAFFAELANDYSPGGTQDVESTRATYFAGQAAMVVWSPFILDEMAGLREEALPTCEQCTDDPAFLAENSGFVSAFTGPSSDEPAQYGNVSALGITADADPAAAQQFAEFWFNDGYVDLLGISPEGKIPLRKGTTDEPEKFSEAWRTLETGVDTKAPLSDFYSEDVVNGLVKGTQDFARWGIGQGQGVLVSGLYESLEVPQVLIDVINGGLDPQAAADELQAVAEDQQE